MFKTKLFIFVILLAAFYTGIYAQTGNIKLSEKTVKEKNAEKRYEFEAVYPQIEGNSAAINKFNETAKNLVTKQVDEFKKSMAEFTDEDRESMPEEMNYEMEIGYSVASAGEDLVSIGFSHYEFTGGAHPNSWSFSLNYDLKNNRELQLKDLFKANSNYLKLVSDYSIADLKKRVGEMSDSEWLQNGAGAKSENYKSWTIYNDGLHFEFDAYQVAAYAAGSFTVIMPYSKIPQTVRSDIMERAQRAEYIGDNPPNWCRNGLFPKMEYFSTAKILGAKNSKTFFYGDDKDCPAGENCRTKSYVIPGDEVIAARQYGGFTCVWYQPAKGNETVGWVETNSLELGYEDPEDTKGKWIGNWVDGQNSIQFVPAKRNGAYMIRGNAIWQGAGDNVHVGELEGTEAPEGNEIKIGASDTDEFACKVTMKIVGKYLIVSDNLNCGGANVSFTGVYLKKKGK